MLPAFVRRYLIHALQGTPTIVDSLVHDIPAEDKIWDALPEPDRFTLREIVAHLADWDLVFLDRIVRTRDEDVPELFPVDVDARAREQHYENAPPTASRELLRERRAGLVAVVSALEPSQWERHGEYRRGERAVDGPVTIEAWVTQTVAHDAYHLRQIAEWLPSAQPG